MSSYSNNSSANNSTSSDIGSAHSSHVEPSGDAQRVFQLTATLITYLSMNIESKLPVAQLDIDPVNSTQLENVQAQTSELYDDSFRALIDLLKLAESYHSKLQILKSKVTNNELISNSEFEYEGGSFKMEGVTIIHKLRGIISQHADSVEQCYQELLNTGENNVIPSLTANIPVLVPVESAGNVAVGLTSYEVYRDFVEELKALGILDKAFQDIQVAIKTKSILEECLRATESARERWEDACRLIFSIEDGSSALATVSLQQIDFTEEKILQFILPMKEYLVRRNEQYGSGIKVVREVDSLCDVIPKIIQDIERISTAKQIIKRDHTAMFSNTAYRLGLVIFQYLKLMRDVFNQRPVDAKTRGSFLKMATFRFSVDAERLLATLHTIVGTQLSSHKSKKAEQNRMVVSTCSNVIGHGMPLVNSAEVRLILQRVERAIAAIHALGIASGTERIVAPIDGNEDGFEMAYGDSLGRLKQVLEENVQAGLERFLLLLREEFMEEEHMSPMGKFFRLNLHKWRR